MGVPPKPSFDIMSLHGPVSRNDVFNSRSQQVTIMRETGREGGPIIECVGFASFGKLYLPFKGFDIFPSL